MAGMQQTSWREERRRDRTAAAQITRDDAAARVQAGLAEAEALSRLRAKERQARQAERGTARKHRAARRGERVAWLRGHVVDLLFVPVIVVPGVLAWSAMAGYGHDIFGVAGFALPSFSEGAMWAFEARATWTARRHPGRPVWHLEAGSWGFAAVGATLNFLGGLTVIPGHPHGLVVGAVKAIVSVAGLVAHQVVTLGPRRSRADRAGARAVRAADRRVRAARRAALRDATIVIDASGEARLVHEPGAVTLARRWGRVVLKEVPLPQAAPVVEVYSWPRPAPVLDAPAPSAPESVADAPRAIERAKESAATAPADAPKAAPRSAPNRSSSARQKGASDRAAKRAKAEKLLRANPAMSRADVVAQSGVSERTADRIRAELPRHLHIAEG